jgi:hypothetical protein
MAIKAVYDKQDEIPEPHRELFTERNGKWEVTGIEGMKPQSAYDAVNEALRKERNDHRDTKKALEPWAGLGKEHGDIQQMLDRFPQLELAAAGKTQQLTEAQIQQHTAPLTRDLANKDKAITALTEENKQLKEKERVRTIHDAVRGAFTESKGLGSALEDALMYAERMFEVTEDGKVVTRDNVGVTPGLDAKLWLQDMVQRKPHWWPSSSGGGAGGSGGGGNFDKNPWSKEHWSLTAQGQVVREKGVDKANQMAKAAGSFVGATVAPAK